MDWMAGGTRSAAEVPTQFTRRTALVTFLPPLDLSIARTWRDAAPLMGGPTSMSSPVPLVKREICHSSPLNISAEVWTMRSVRSTGSVNLSQRGRRKGRFVHVRKHFVDLSAEGRLDAAHEPNKWSGRYGVVKAPQDTGVGLGKHIRASADDLAELDENAFEMKGQIMDVLGGLLMHSGPGLGIGLRIPPRTARLEPVPSRSFHGHGQHRGKSVGPGTPQHGAVFMGGCSGEIIDSASVSALYHLDKWHAPRNPRVSCIIDSRSTCTRPCLVALPTPYSGDGFPRKSVCFLAKRRGCEPSLAEDTKKWLSSSCRTSGSARRPRFAPSSATPSHDGDFHLRWQNHETFLDSQHIFTNATSTLYSRWQRTDFGPVYYSADLKALRVSLQALAPDGLLLNSLERRLITVDPSGIRGLGFQMLLVPVSHGTDFQPTSS